LRRRLSSALVASVALLAVAGGCGSEAHVEEATNATKGRQLFIQECGGCHTLADAGASGTVGPSLDAAKPSASLVTERVTNGLGGMPAFAGSLSGEEIAAVAAYVSTAAQG
jgi:mono/diheme cytochrome c family protein